MNVTPIYGKKLPEIIDLPLYRDTYISRQQVNDFCTLLWCNKPLTVEYLVNLISSSPTGEEALGNPVGRRTLNEKLGEVSYFFEKEAEKGNIEPISYIAMVDLIYEIERRIRKALGLADFVPFGEQIAPSPEVPIPQGFPLYNIIKNDPTLMNCPKILEDFKGKIPKEYPPNRDKLYQRLFKEHPDIGFALSEGIRRSHDAYNVSSVIGKILKEYENEQKQDN
jgi:hypothetical protein